MDITKYIYSHCVSPVETKVFDAYTGNKVTRLVPCGKCLHCKNQHKNEWTTRLYAHAKYVKNVYYFTLDYKPFDTQNETAIQLARETAAAWHDINYTHHFGLHPILLKREHLQKFFKRLRKQHPERGFQYFACGEYGTHANGTGYGRPHFHIVLFSNDTFTEQDIRNAWTLNGYSIGNKLDFNDLRANGSFFENKQDSSMSARFVFAYVCKYLQKDSFDWSKLATLEYHKAYFNTCLQYVSWDDEDTLFPKRKINSLEQNETDTDIERYWRNYCKIYSPFVCCSKRPAIGLQYFEDNVQRFQTQDFRLFGLSKNCRAFPRYYLRKTKESLCRYVAMSAITEGATSNSSIGRLVSLLDSVRNSWNSIESWTDDSALVWRSDSKGEHGETRLVSSTDSLLDRARAPRFKNIELSFYDLKEHVFYFWSGYDFVLKRKIRGIGFVTLGTLPLDNAITLLRNEWQPYYADFITKQHNSQVLSAAELVEEKKRLFNDDFEEKFKIAVQRAYEQELLHWNQKRDIISNTKKSF